MRCLSVSIVVLAISTFSTSAAAMNLSQYPFEVQADNPIAYFRLNETAGSTQALDSVGGRIGTASGAVTFGTTTGPLAFGADTVATFSPSGSGKIDVPFDPTLNPTTFSFELFARVQGSTGDFRSPLTSRTGTGGAGGYLFYAANSDTWQYWIGTGAGWDVDTGPAVQIGQWTHLVGTYDGNTGEKVFYVNGVPEASDIGISLNQNATHPFRIGAGATETAGQFFFDGDIAEVAFYDTVLAPERVLAHFDARLQEFIVPEPSTAWLGWIGAAAAVRISRRRRRRRLSRG